MQRRFFLQASATTALASQRVLGANDRIGVALIGSGGRGRGVTAYVPKIGGAEVRGVSDVYVPRREQAAQQFGATAKAFADYREVLDSKDIDAVVIGTPDHWHAPMTIEAVQAGKDVYVEKPVTHNLAEGDKLVKAVEESGRVVATGTQQRSWKHYLEAKRLIDQGVLGKITFVRCHWSQNYSRFGANPAPEVDLQQLDWNQWLGSAPKQPFDKVRFRFWRFFWDFGGGSITDLMTHWIDVIQWFMKSPRASEVHAAGATYTQDWLEAPDTVTATMVFPEGYMVAYEGNMTFGLLGGGIVFRGDKAMMTLNRLGYAVYEEGARPFEAVSLPEPVHHFSRREDTSTLERVDGTGTLDNVRNWLDCMRDRSTPNAHIRAGVEAAATSHWANKALREGRVIKLS
jgi:predicted dehydrogenase